MHLVRSTPAKAGEGAAAEAPGSGLLFPRCGNPRCATGWMRLWRSRRVPAFEGRWACSPECMADLVAGAVRRELDGGDSTPAPHLHRLPMGLMLIDQGKITPEQLHAALEAQRREAARGGESVRLGEWLLRSGILSEPALTRALSAQWNCPVFTLDAYRPEEVAGAVPHFLSEALGALPLPAPGGRLLYVAYSGRIDRSLSYALERMTGLPVAAGIASDSEFGRAQARYLETAAPRIRLLEAANSWILARTVTKLLEAERPVEARLARVHEYYWLRLWRRRTEGLPACDAVEDLLATVGTGRRNSE